MEFITGSSVNSIALSVTLIPLHITGILHVLSGTDYTRNIFEQDIVPEIDKVAQVIYKDRKYYMQVFDRIPAQSVSKYLLKILCL